MCGYFRMRLKRNLVSACPPTPVSKSSHFSNHEHHFLDFQHYGSEQFPLTGSHAFLVKIGLRLQRVRRGITQRGRRLRSVQDDDVLRSLQSCRNDPEFSQVAEWHDQPAGRYDPAKRHRLVQKPRRDHRLDFVHFIERRKQQKRRSDPELLNMLILRTMITAVFAAILPIVALFFQGQSG